MIPKNLKGYQHNQVCQEFFNQDPSFKAAEQFQELDNRFLRHSFVKLVNLRVQDALFPQRIGLSAFFWIEIGKPSNKMTISLFMRMQSSAVHNQKTIQNHRCLVRFRSWRIKLSKTLESGRTAMFGVLLIALHLDIRSTSTKRCHLGWGTRRIGRKIQFHGQVGSTAQCWSHLQIKSTTKQLSKNHAWFFMKLLA